MLWLFVVLSAIALLLGVTCLEFDLRERRLAAQGRHGFEELRERTGLTRAELVAHLGPPGRDGTFRVTLEQRAALPWGPPPLDPYHPLGNAVACALLAAGLVLTVTGGAPAWWTLGAGGGYLLVCLVWALVGIWREGPVDDEDDDDPELADVDAALDAIEREEGRLDLATTCARLADVTERIERGLAREEASDRQDLLMPLSIRLLLVALWRWQRWRVARMTRGIRREQGATAALAERVERDMLTAHLGALEAEARGAPRLAEVHREHEATCRRLLRGIDGRGDGEDD